MSRSRTMTELQRIIALAAQCERTGESAADAIGNEAPQDVTRRRLFQGAAAGAAVTTAGALAPRAWATASGTLRTVVARVTNTRGVAIVGAGIAGLACATELARLGVSARVFESSARVGGRINSLRGFFPGQVAERGAEFIGTSHHTMLGYARMLELELEAPRVGASRSDRFCFGGQVYSQAQVVDEYRAFAAAIGDELTRLQSPTADRFTEAATLLDFMSLTDFLDLYDAGPLLRGMVDAACVAEFGVAPEETSAIAFLRFVHGDRRTKLGAFNAAREDHVHVVGGNDLITSGLAAKLPTPVAFDHRLVAMRKTAGGLVRLTFDLGAGRLVDSDHDAVVLALPFSVLRNVDIHASVEMPEYKRVAIAGTVTGDASKLMVGFKSPFWSMRDRANGSVQADLPRLRNTWETNASRGATTRAVLSHQVGGAAGRLLRTQTLQTDTAAFLADLEGVLPGATGFARRDAKGNVQAFVENWSTNPHSLGAYVAPRPGYFTTIAHNEGKPVGNLFFAGDHTSSFYEWQGFMEGAALSGLRAAAEASTLMLGR